MGARRAAPARADAHAHARASMPRRARFLTLVLSQSHLPTHCCKGNTGKYKAHSDSTTGGLCPATLMSALNKSAGVEVLLPKSSKQVWRLPQAHRTCSMQLVPLHVKSSFMWGECITRLPPIEPAVRLYRKGKGGTPSFSLSNPSIVPFDPPAAFPAAEYLVAVNEVKTLSGTRVLLLSRGLEVLAEAPLMQAWPAGSGGCAKGSRPLKIGRRQICQEPLRLFDPKLVATADGMYVAGIDYLRGLDAWVKSLHGNSKRVPVPEQTVGPSGLKWTLTSLIAPLHVRVVGPEAAAAGRAHRSCSLAAHVYNRSVRVLGRCGGRGDGKPAPIKNLGMFPDARGRLQSLDWLYPTATASLDGLPAAGMLDPGMLDRRGDAGAGAGLSVHCYRAQAAPAADGSLLPWQGVAALAGAAGEPWTNQNAIRPETGAHVFHNGGTLQRLPAWLGGELLGVAHIHRGYGGQAARWGHHYSHFWFTLAGAPPYALSRVSAEFCFGTPWTRKGQCEVVQFASSLLIDPRRNSTLFVGFGVLDRNALIVRLELSTVLRALRPIRPNQTERSKAITRSNQTFVGSSGSN